MEQNELLNKIQNVCAQPLPESATLELRELVNQYFEACTALLVRLQDFKKILVSKSIPNPMSFLVSLESALQEYRTLDLHENAQWNAVLRVLGGTDVPTLDIELYSFLKNSVEHIRKRMIQKNLEKLQLDASDLQEGDGILKNEEWEKPSDADGSSSAKAPVSPRTVAPPPLPENRRSNVTPPDPSAVFKEAFAELAAAVEESTSKAASSSKIAGSSKASGSAKNAGSSKSVGASKNAGSAKTTGSAKPAGSASSESSLEFNFPEMEERDRTSNAQNEFNASSKTNAQYTLNTQNGTCTSNGPNTECVIPSPPLPGEPYPQPNAQPETQKTEQINVQNTNSAKAENAPSGRWNGDRKNLLILLLLFTNFFQAGTILIFCIIFFRIFGWL